MSFKRKGGCPGGSAGVPRGFRPPTTDLVVGVPPPYDGFSGRGGGGYGWG
jgi:hypothetical protein